MAKIRNEAWITSILKDEDVSNALLLAHSLQRHRTNRTIAAVVVQDVSSQERRKLRESFDAVFLLDDAFLGNLEMPLEMKAKIFAISLPVFKKCVFTVVKHMVNGNVDDIFEETVKWRSSDKLTPYSKLQSTLLMSSAELRSQGEIENFFESDWDESKPLDDLILPLRTFDVPEKYKRQLPLIDNELNELNVELKDSADSAPGENKQVGLESENATEPTPTKKRALLGKQDYSKIKEECLKEGKLFEDPYFPVDDVSLFTNPLIKGEIIVKRPREICQDPQFFVSQASRFDINQGRLGNCWYLASVASLTLNEKIFSAVVPADNTFEEGQYCGAFHFRFWKNGERLDIVIDDRLPTQNDKLVYVRSKDRNEFWGALLEKAYAKLHGSYHNIDGGLSNEAFIHFMGGINEFYLTKDSPPNMFEMLVKAEKQQSFLSCATLPVKKEEDVSNEGEEENKEHKNGEENKGPEKKYDNEEIVPNEIKKPTGLFMGHMYSITKTFIIPETGIRLLRLRNPHGQGEWKGAWSDGSEEWNSISEDQKQELDLTNRNDGEFWMRFEDVLTHFGLFEICHWSADDFNLGGDFGGEDEGSKKWHCCMHEDKWISGATAGGYPKAMDESEREDFPLESFASNPQYVVTLVNPDEDDDANKCTLLVALLQKTSRHKKREKNLPIGFRVFHVPEPETQRKPLPAAFFLSNEPVADEPEFLNILQVCKRFSLDPGTYVIVPFTLVPNMEGEFILRVYTESKVEMLENERKICLLGVETHLVRDDTVEKERIEEMFKEMGGENEEISWKGLKTILDSTIEDAAQLDGGFPNNFCRTLIGVKSEDLRGKLKLNDVFHLFKCVSTWTRAFKMYDTDNNGHLYGYELRNVFASLGFGVDKKMMQIISVRHGDDKGNLTFDEFIKCAVKLKTIWDLLFSLPDDEDDDDEESESGDQREEGASAAITIEKEVSIEEEWFYPILYL